MSPVLAALAPSVGRALVRLLIDRFHRKGGEAMWIRSTSAVPYPLLSGTCTESAPVFPAPYVVFILYLHAIASSYQCNCDGPIHGT